MTDTSLDELNGKLVIGIDLGTTKSGVAVYSEQERRPVMLRDANGDDTIPSIVAWDRDTDAWLVGKPAKAVLELRPWDVAYSVKRFIGRSFSDRAVAAGRGSVTYDMAGAGVGSDLTRNVLVRLGQEGGVRHTLDIPTISSMVLLHLRQTAATALGLSLDEVTYAVVTVPAYFDTLQRKATQAACEAAGLKARILHEPIAAALAHGDELLAAKERTILVYDLGGGTFDISLLDVSRDARGYQFFTRLIDGHTQLGGDDIDAAISSMLEREIERSTGEVVR
ncbi:MAG: Hsp70 family protein, partial [Gemmatimonadaceae bacterium]